MRHTTKALPLLLLLLAACATASRVADTVSDVAADALVTVEQENELGKQMSAEVEKELTVHADDDVQAYLGNLGKKVAAAAKADTPDGIRYRFRVIDDDETVNAFALPGGYIYVYTGLMKRADNEAEIVGVLGHEVGHVTQRHIAKRLIAMYGIEAVTKMALGEEPGLVGELIAAVVGGGAMLTYGRDQERESDTVGLGYARKAGWDPMGFVTFFEKLAADEGSPLLVILQSHPMPSERMTVAKTMVNGMKDRPTKTGEEELAAIKDKL
jgi:predicted Zn-dependent protease